MCIRDRKKVKYTVVADYYLTPTAVAFADCVLPMAMSLSLIHI